MVDLVINKVHCVIIFNYDTDVMILCWTTHAPLRLRFDIFTIILIF